MIHPDISKLINLAKQNGFNNPDRETIVFLSTQNASQTQAIFVLYQGYGITLEKAEEMIQKDGKLFKPESLEDSIYETFLYENYDPHDPNFKADENMVRFSMKRREQ
jgi:hypothetical protein